MVQHFFSVMHLPFHINIGWFPQILLHYWQMIVNIRLAFKHWTNVQPTFKRWIADLADHLYNNLDMNLSTAATFLDLSKLFDIVEHDTLLEKFEWIVIRGLVRKLIRDCLSNMKQITKVNDTISDVCGAHISVLYGTIWWPLLSFNYMTDIFKVKKIMK